MFKFEPSENGTNLAQKPRKSVKPICMGYVYTGKTPVYSTYKEKPINQVIKELQGLSALFFYYKSLTKPNKFDTNKLIFGTEFGTLHQAVKGLRYILLGLFHIHSVFIDIIQNIVGFVTAYLLKLFIRIA